MTTIAQLNPSMNNNFLLINNYKNFKVKHKQENKNDVKIKNKKRKFY